ncbi:MAG: 3-phosphoshikimate 1-carboxyvinyltransferase [Kiritimatiellaeota bacterium]|nr:3-phosphoshikimate 1-carboxyvinyltransferase [Kiritimatiellota bacterium]
MEFHCHSSTLRGQVSIPASKSHTIRAVVLGGLAKGESVLEAPLLSGDTRSAIAGMRALGAEIGMEADVWRVVGTRGRPRVRTAEIDVGNSGTTLRTLLGTASLLREGRVTLTGDEQIRRRPAGPLAEALNTLGASVTSLCGNGCAPFMVGGLLRGGRAVVEAVTSQYVTSLLLACPLAEGATVLEIPLLNERPYVQMTLDWLAFLGVDVPHAPDLCTFHIPGGRDYSAFRRRIPADFSSATFFLGAGALGDNEVACIGLDMHDSQADKAVVDYLREMGAEVTVDGNAVAVRGRGLHGVELDLNETPDALPVMAVLGCFAEGRTVLRNVAHARIKETDRIAVMACELRKLGGDVEELPDGLVIRHSRLRGARVEGHGDHRVVMALAMAGLAIPGNTVVTTAGAADITFPNYADLMQALGGHIEKRRATT